MTVEPLWLAFARTQIGVKEVAGPGNSPTIMGWAKKVGTKFLGIVYGADSTAWCGLFVSRCMVEVGINPPAIAVRASAWDNWGVTCKPTVGCVLRFSRSGGGHVGFYIGEDETCYHVLGGNQSDQVNITRIEKSRMVESRWPKDHRVSTQPLKMTGSGAVSKNEA
jgi:uncharacterized protein (TIGR02594 family)